MKSCILAGIDGENVGGTPSRDPCYPRGGRPNCGNDLSCRGTERGTHQRRSEEAGQVPASVCMSRLRAPRRRARGCAACFLPVLVVVRAPAACVDIG